MALAIEKYILEKIASENLERHYLEKAAEARAAGKLLSAYGFEKLAENEEKKRANKLRNMVIAATIMTAANAATNTDAPASDAIESIGKDAPDLGEAERERRKREEEARRKKPAPSGGPPPKPPKV
jgi:predicted phage-related endonuclease